MRLLQLVLVVTIVLLVTACSTSPIGSVTGSECKIVRAPEYAVKGKTAYDQNWIDDTTVGIVAGCNQPRPKARPASLDAPVISKAMPLPKPAPKKKRLRDAIKKLLNKNTQ